METTDVKALGIRISPQQSQVPLTLRRVWSQQKHPKEKGQGLNSYNKPLWHVYYVYGYSTLWLDIQDN